MNIPLTLICSLAAALGGNIAKKYYTNKGSSGIFGVCLFNSVGFLTAAVILLCSDGLGKASLFTALLGLAFGAITVLQGIMNIVALQCGPMSYTSVIISFSTIISALSGAMFFGEKIGASHIVGMILMLASFVLSIKRDSEEKSANLKWLLLCLITFLATGAIGIMQKVHQSSQFKDELNTFLIIAFFASAILCAVFTFLFQNREKPTQAMQTTASRKLFWLLLAIMLINGACIAINNKFNLYLSGVMDSAIFFPVVNGGGLVLTTLAAVLIFRERLSKTQWIGIVFGIASVIFLCNPFA